MTPSNVPNLSMEAHAFTVEADPYAEGYAAGRLEERAAVVAGAPPSFTRDALALVAAADVIERGQHLVDLAPKPATPTLKE